MDPPGPAIADARPTTPIAAVDLLVDVLSQADEASVPHEFYSRLTEAVCRLTGMRRAVIFRYDDVRRSATATGSHGVELERFAGVDVTVEAAPTARRALEEDRVIEVRSAANRDLPEPLAQLVGDHPIVYVPIAAANRWIGVMVADPGAGAPPLDDAGRDLLWTLGKTLALALSSRIATFHSERARELEERIDLARDIHDGVIQRLFGVSMALSMGPDLDAAAQRRCADEVQAALTELRTALQRPLGRPSRRTQTTLAAELGRLRAQHPDLGISVSEPIADVPEELEPLAQSVLAEAIRNARKHASAARVLVRVLNRDGAFVLEVENDGVGSRRGRSTGMGLRLAALEALQAGGLVEFGQREPGRWQVRLAVPLAPESGR